MLTRDVTRGLVISSATSICKISRRMLSDTHAIDIIFLQLFKKFFFFHTLFGQKILSVYYINQD